jgi:hypothetical protein
VPLRDVDHHTFRRATWRITSRAAAKHAPQRCSRCCRRSWLTVRRERRERSPTSPVRPGDTLVHDGLRDIAGASATSTCAAALGGTRIAGVLLTMDDRQGCRRSRSSARPRRPGAPQRLHGLQEPARRLRRRAEAATSRPPSSTLDPATRTRSRCGRLVVNAGVARALSACARAGGSRTVAVRLNAGDSTSSTVRARGVRRADAAATHTVHHLCAHDVEPTVSRSRLAPQLLRPSPRRRLGAAACSALDLSQSLSNRGGHTMSTARHDRRGLVRRAWAAASFTIAGTESCCTGRGSVALRRLPGGRRTPSAPRTNGISVRVATRLQSPRGRWTRRVPRRRPTHRVRAAPTVVVSGRRACGAPRVRSPSVHSTGHVLPHRAVRTEGCRRRRADGTCAHRPIGDSRWTSSRPSTTGRRPARRGRAAGERRRHRRASST